MDIITLNANAVDLMRRGSLQQAVSVFRVAINELLQSVSDDDQEQDMDLTDKETRTFLPVRSVPLGTTLSLLLQDQNTFSIFDRPLLIDTTHLTTADSFADQNSLNSLTVIILFNMGLASQLLGMQDLCSQQASFKKAMRLYQLASTTLKKSGDEGNCLVCLALSNNMGHIHSHFCEGIETQGCLDCLRAGLHALHSSSWDILEDECLLPFHLNILVLHGQAAAAAA
jgi:hypothetical protein